MQEHLMESYKYHRQRDHAAFVALETARADVANGKRRYSGSFWRDSAWNPKTSSYGCKHCRWIEDTQRAGLRLVGTYDEIMRRNERRADHTAWFVDPWQEETATPVVYQLPARNGRSVFAYGYDDWNNKGAAFLCFDNDADDEIEAARFADSLTERMSEAEREYQEAWQAGRQFESLADDIKDARTVIRELAAELRQASIAQDSLICKTLRESIERKFREIERARDKRRELESDYGHCDAFRDA